MQKSNKESKIVIILETREKSKWVREANAYGLKLSAYIKAKVNGLL